MSELTVQRIGALCLLGAFPSLYLGIILLNPKFRAEGIRWISFGGLGLVIAMVGLIICVTWRLGLE